MSLDYKVFDSMLDAVIVIDVNCGVHYANTAASILCDMSVKRFKGGKPLTQFLELSDDLTDDAKLPLEEQTSYRELSFTATATSKQGWAQVSVQPDLSLGGVPDDDARWILFIRDVSLEKALHNKYKGELDQKEKVISDLEKARVELENYSKNLESMVAERTLQLNEKTVTLSAILDSLDQGILVFDENGKCLPFASKASRTVLETNGDPTESASIASILRIPADESDTFTEWINAAFGDMLPFEDIAGLGPNRFAHSQGKEIQLTYNQMRDAGQSLKGIVVVATDKTNEVEAKKEAARERAAARRILQILKHRTQFKSFAVEAIRMLERLQTHALVDQEQTARDLHTIKGASASFAMIDIAALAHEAEQALLEGRADAAAHFKSLQAEFLKFLDDNADLYGGLQNGSARAVEIPAPELYKWIGGSSALTPALRESVSEAYLKTPVQSCFSAYDDMIQELGERLQKKVAPLKFIGGDIRIVPEPYAELWSAYAHVFRNALDHGIETPDVRELAGKPSQATLTISVEQRSEAGAPWLRLIVSDDGAGAKFDRIRAKLSENPKLQSFLQASEPEMLQVIFEPAFSTGQSVTDLSGRGVGLSALKFAATELGGTAVAFSQAGAGLTIQVDVPDIQPEQAFAHFSATAKKIA